MSKFSNFSRLLVNSLPDIKCYSSHNLLERKLYFINNLFQKFNNSRLVQPFNIGFYNEIKDHKIQAPEHFRHIFPDFLPEPKFEHRNRLKEKLERKDMVARRNIIDIPEFYTGSIMAVTVSDPNASGKTNRFVGICIDRGGHGLRSWFILRNVVDNLGVEILYEMYCPLLLSLEVLKLEKRLDETLYYLRDCLPEFSSFPFDMEQEPMLDDASVPINPIKAILKPRPWLERWDRQNLQGVEMMKLPLNFAIRAKQHEKPWEKYDLMKEYRLAVPEEEQNVIYTELVPHMPKFEAARRRIKRIRIQKE